MTGKMRWAMMMILAAAFMSSGCQQWRNRRQGRTDRRAERRGEVTAVHGQDILVGEIPMLEGERPIYETEVRDQFEVVFFGLDSSTVMPAERAKVEDVADYLRRNRAVSVLVEGHTCERGSAEYNLALGERRALAVRAYLVGLGIEPHRVQTVSYGEERPAVLGQGEHMLRQNRRVEFVIVR